MQLLEDIFDGSSMTLCDVELLAVVVCSVVLTSVLDHPAWMCRLQAILQSSCR